MTSEDRFPELDALRGLAVLSMIAYHFCFDLAFFYGWDIPVREGWYSLWARGTAMMFLMVMGICFVISWERSESRMRNQESERVHKTHCSKILIYYSRFLAMYPKYIRRGVTIFLGGMIITIATFFLTPGAAVKFGILHLIGVSALLQPLFVRFGLWNAVIGIAWTAVGIRITSLRTESILLFPLGIPYTGFFSLDYYPLFPWFGTVLMGMAMGSLFYVPGRLSTFQRLDCLPYPPALLWTGKRALFLYFVHQPIILSALSWFIGVP
jgi:uncharacterized membrane protein